jgi:enamine deaminase RidA (YjgF/YER057c/UK114 family)
MTDSSEAATVRRVVGTDVFSVPGLSFAPAIRIRAQNDIVFLSGITARAADGTIVGPGDVEAQARAVFDNMQALLLATGASLADVVKTTTYVRSWTDIAKVGRIRMEYWKGDPPTSTSVEVAGLADPRQLVEVEAIAVLPPDGVE